MSKKSVAVLLALSAILAFAVLPVVQGKLRHKNFHGALNHRLQEHEIFAPHPTSTSGLFTTQLDNINRNTNATFQLRYLVNDTVFQPATGPVLFMLGGEGPISPAYLAGHFIINEYAEKLGMKKRSRFYGESLPGGPNSDTPVSQLKYLSSQQALADAAAFQAFIVQQYNLSTSNQWIVFGGSYSGCLSAWAKFLYPTLFAGAISASAPVQAELDFYQYFDVVENSVGEQCGSAIKSAIQTAEMLLQSAEGQQKLQDVFTLCAPMQSNDDIATFMETLSDPIAEAVQYSDDNNAAGKIDVNYVCSQMLNGTDPLSNLANLVKTQNNATCVDVSYKNMIGSLQPSGAGRSWTWQTCVEFGFYQTGESSQQPFSSRISLDYFVKQCQDIYGIQGMTPNITATNMFYQSTDIQTANTFFSNGDVDPWHVLGVLSGDHGPNTQFRLMHGTAHCADLYATSPQDLPDLTQTRALQFQAIKDWIGAN